MIVWGGNDGTVFLKTGGRYNPATDSWVNTSVTYAPFARSYHTAVWTGTDMIVWGGSDGSNYLNTGGRYDPTSDTWIDTTTENAPTGRFAHTAVWTGSRMIVWGGYNGNSFTYFNTGASYDPSTDTWTATATAGAPSARETAISGLGLEAAWLSGEARMACLKTRADVTTRTQTHWTTTSTSGAPRLATTTQPSGRYRNDCLGRHRWLRLSNFGRTL